MFIGQLLKVTAAKPLEANQAMQPPVTCQSAGEQLSRTEVSGGSTEEECLYFGFRFKQLWESAARVCHSTGEGFSPARLPRF